MKYFRRYSLDHYSALWTSLQVKPDAVRIPELLGEMDHQASSQLLNIWRKSLRDHGSIDRIAAPIDRKYMHNSNQIWKTALAACAHQSPSLLPGLYTALKPKLAEVPKRALDHTIRILLRRPQPGLPALIKEIPDHILRDLIDQNAELWSSTLLFPQLMVPLANRGILPRSTAAINSLLSLSPTAKVQYIDALTAFLAESKLCTSLNPRLCRFVIENAAPSQLAPFYHAVKNAQQAPGRAHPLNHRSIVALDKRSPHLTTGSRDLALALNADTVAQAYNNIANWGSRLHNSPRNYTLLYANWLRCCARDSPHDLARFYESARAAVFGQLGSTQGRERVLLSGAVQGLVATRNWEMLKTYIPSIKKTGTPYLWNAAITAAKDWDLVEQMHARNIPLCTESMRKLVSSGELADLRKLLRYHTPLPSAVVAELLSAANKKNLYDFAGLIKFYRQVFEAIAADMRQGNDIIFPVLDADTIKQVVWGALRTKPKEPWTVTPFLKEYVDIGLTTKETVAAGISSALDALQASDGTAVHIRNHSLISVPQLVKRFNAEWNLKAA